MIRTIHKIISFPNRVFGPRTIIRLFSKPFRRFLLIIFTVFRFLSPRFVSPRSKLPIPFVPSPLAFPNFFSTRPNFCAFIYLFRRHVEYYMPDPCRNETFRSSVLDESYLRRSSCYDEYRIVALCKWNTCKGRIGENKEAEGGKFNEIIAFFYANRIEANAFFWNSISKFLSTLVWKLGKKQRRRKIVRQKSSRGNEDIGFLLFLFVARQEFGRFF